MRILNTIYVIALTTLSLDLFDEVRYICVATNNLPICLFIRLLLNALTYDYPKPNNHQRTLKKDVKSQTNLINFLFYINKFILIDFSILYIYFID